MNLKESSAILRDVYGYALARVESHCSPRDGESHGSMGTFLARLTPEHLRSRRQSEAVARSELRDHPYADNRLPW